MNNQPANPSNRNMGPKPQKKTAASEPTVDVRVHVRALRVFPIGGCTVSPGKEFQTAKSIADKMVAAGDAVILGTVY